MLSKVKKFFVDLINEVQKNIDGVLVALSMMGNRIADIKDTATKINKKLDNIEKAVSKPVKTSRKKKVVVK